MEYDDLQDTMSLEGFERALIQKVCSQAMGDMVVRELFLIKSYPYIASIPKVCEDDRIARTMHALAFPGLEGLLAVWLSCQGPFEAHIGPEAMGAYIMYFHLFYPYVLHRLWSSY